MQHKGVNDVTFSGSETNIQTTHKVKENMCPICARKQNHFNLYPAQESLSIYYSTHPVPDKSFVLKLNVFAWLWIEEELSHSILAEQQRKQQHLKKIRGKRSHIIDSMMTSTCMKSSKKDK